MSSDSFGMKTSWIISERSRMKPTCGPLPWVTTTRQPASTSVATSHAAARALPPMAMTAERGMLLIRSTHETIHAQLSGDLLSCAQMLRKPRDGDLAGLWAAHVGFVGKEAGGFG